MVNTIGHENTAFQEYAEIQDTVEEYAVVDLPEINIPLEDPQPRANVSTLPVDGQIEPDKEYAWIEDEKNLPKDSYTIPEISADTNSIYAELDFLPPGPLSGEKGAELSGQVGKSVTRSGNLEGSPGNLRWHLVT